MRSHRRRSFEVTRLILLVLFLIRTLLIADAPMGRSEISARQPARFNTLDSRPDPSPDGD